MNKTNKVRKGEVRIYGGKTYVAIPEIKEDHCAGCCFYNEGCCSIRDFDHIDFPDCHNSGMIWMQKEINMSDIKEKAIKLAIDAMKPIPICSSPCYNISAYICIHKIITYSHPSGMDRWEYKNSQSNCLKQLTGYFFCHTISVIFPCQSTN